MTFNLRSRAARNVVTAAIVSATSGGSCHYEAGRFNSMANNLPCRGMTLPKVAGAEPLAENLCIAISGEAPQKIGIESKKIGEGRFAHTLFLEWDFDGLTEVLKHHKPDAEPMTLITDEDGKPLQLQWREHWRVKMQNFDDCKNNLGKVVIAITNSFHTPVVMGCKSKHGSPESSSWTDGAISSVTDFYARLTGSASVGTFWPFLKAEKNDPPSQDHPARTQPIYAER